MFSVYQSIFFVGIGLLAIVVAVFVLAVSLLGRAIKMSAQEQSKAEEKAKAENEDKIKELQEKLKRAKGKPHIDVQGFEQTLRDLKKKDARYNWNLRIIRNKPKLLTATWGALVPGASFLISIILSVEALYNYDIKSMGTASTCMYISLVAIGVGIIFVCLILKVIEGVAITSEETAFSREVQIFKTSMKEFEEERKPKLTLRFYTPSPPFHIKIDSSIKVEFGVSLITGDVAEDVEVGFFVPPGFTLPDINTVTQEADHSIAPFYITGVVDYMKPISKGMCRTSLLLVKAPHKAGEYSCYYKISCPGYVGEFEKFEIIVE